MTATCPTHGTQPITALGPDTVTLACGARGNTEDGWWHRAVLDLDHRRSPIPDGLDTEEWHAVAHLRGWCHDGRKCPICKQSDRAHRAERELDRIISG